MRKRFDKTNASHQRKPQSHTSSVTVTLLLVGIILLFTLFFYDDLSAFVLAYVYTVKKSQEITSSSTKAVVDIGIGDEKCEDPIWCTVKMPTKSYFGFEPPADPTRWRQARRTASRYLLIRSSDHSLRSLTVSLYSAASTCSWERLVKWSTVSCLAIWIIPPDEL